MDDRHGQFEKFDNETKLNQRLAELESSQKRPGSIFEIGEIVKIKDSKFKIRSIGKKEIRLRLLAEKN